MKNIIVAIDADERSGILIDHAIKLGKKFESKIWIVHIVTPETGYVGLVVAPQYVSNVMENEHKAEHELLRKMEYKVKNEGLEAEGIFIEGPTVEMIIEEAKKLSADLIIIGSHEHSFLHNALFGTTHGMTIKRAGIPVLVVPII